MCRTLLECKFVSSIIVILLLIMGFFTFILCDKYSFNLDFIYIVLIVILFFTAAFITIFIAIYLYNRIIYLNEFNTVLNHVLKDTISESSSSCDSDLYNNIL